MSSFRAELLRASDVIARDKQAACELQDQWEQLLLFES